MDAPEDFVQRLQEVVGVESAEPIEGRPEFLIRCESEAVDSNQLLQNLLQLGVPISGFNEDRKHLNEAFMDLTERGVRT